MLAIQDLITKIVQSFIAREPIFLGIIFQNTERKYY